MPSSVDYKHSRNRVTSGTDVYTNAKQTKSVQYMYVHWFLGLQVLRNTYTIHCMVLLSMALLRQYIPPTAKWYFLPGSLSWAFILTLLGDCQGEPDLGRENKETGMYTN